MKYGYARVSTDDQKVDLQTAALKQAGCAGSVAVCDQVRAVDKARLVRHIGKLSESDLLALGNGVRQVLGMP